VFFVRSFYNCFAIAPSSYGFPEGIRQDDNILLTLHQHGMSYYGTLNSGSLRRVQTVPPDHFISPHRIAFPIATRFEK